MGVSFKTRLEVYKLLEEHLSADGDRFIYDEGWSDARVARTVNAALPGVKQFRNKEFGSLRSSENPKHGKSLTIRIHDLERRMARLEKIFGAHRDVRDDETASEELEN